jgi:hypothetical protein
MKKINLAYISVLILIALFAALFSGCSYSFGSVNSESNGQIDASYVTLNEERDKSIKLDEGQMLILDYTATVKKGTLNLSVTSSDNEKLWEVTLNKDGADKVEIPIKKTGTYKINMKGQDTGGGYHIKIEKK